MKLLEVGFIGVRIPLNRPLRCPSGVSTHKEALLVRIVTDEGQGWGECSVGTQPSRSSEFLDAAHLVLRDHLVPRLFALTDLRVDHALAAMAAITGHHAAKTALEMAVLDAQLQADGSSLMTYLGGVARSVPSGTSTSFTEDPDELTKQVEQLVLAGYRRVRVQIAPGWDMKPLQLVSERLQPRTKLQADGQGSYDRSAARALERLDELDLLHVQQPLAVDQLVGHAELAGRLRHPICLVSTITSAAVCAQVIELGAAQVIGIDPATVGGYTEARRIHDLCAAHDIPVWCESGLDTGIARAANLAFASLPNCTIPSELGASDQHLRHDITEPIHLDGDGMVPVPQGAGLGVEIDERSLERVTVGFERVVRP